MIASIEAASPGQAVEESNLTVPVAALRPELGKAPGGARWIETLPRRGYRFVDPIDTRDRNAIATASSAPEDLGATIARHDPTHAARRKQEPERHQSDAHLPAWLRPPPRRTCATQSARIGIALQTRWAPQRLGRSHISDAVLAYFGYPAAHEDDAEQAVRAALELHSRRMPVSRIALPCRHFDRAGDHRRRDRCRRGTRRRHPR